MELFSIRIQRTFQLVSTLYRIDGDGEGCHIRIGTKECRFMSEGCPHTLHVMGWGRYMRN